MGWKITTSDNKYQIKYGNNANYINDVNDISYLTITSNRLFGINNANPSSNYLLDINGITHINNNLHVDGNMYTSNIIGYDLYNSSNILTFNNSSTNNYSNNIVEIYGRTSLYGKVYISSNATNAKYSPHLLDVEGSIRASNIYGDGCNITNLDANNINGGILPIARGGTGINILIPKCVLFANSEGSKFEQVSDFRFEDGKIKGPFDLKDAVFPTLKVLYGGTGVTNVPTGEILFGSDNSLALNSEGSFKYLTENNTLNVDNLNIANELKVSSIKYKGSDGSYSDLHYSNVGVRDANYDVLGLVKPSIKDFSFTGGILGIKETEGNIWSVPNNANANNISICYPTIAQQSGLTPLKGNIGINTTTPRHPLDVTGDINTSNGKFMINGSNLDDLMNAKIDLKNMIFSEYLLSNIDVTGVLRANQAILTKGNLLNDSWKLKTMIGSDATTTTKIKFTDLEVDTFNVLTNMTIKTAAGSAGDTFSIIRREINNNETKLFRFDTSGLIISDNIPAGSSDEKLVIGGNIKAEGNIKAGGYVRSYYSDNRLKTFTSNITNALNIIDTLNGFYYVPNEKALQFGFEYDNEIGLSAQEVKKVIPEIVKIAPFDSTKVNEKVVSKSGEEYLTICYERLGPVFVEAIKELRKENKCLKNEIVTIKKDLDNIKKIIYIQ
jgi:hypothetical protein